MKSYLKHLQSTAHTLNVDLLFAFKKAGVPTSTYYRTINNKTDLRYTTACKVLESIHDQHKVASQLQSNDYNAYRSEARKET